jgi:diguanylate cyclase (GGDEF)-like protein
LYPLTRILTRMLHKPRKLVFFLRLCNTVLISGLVYWFYGWDKFLLACVSIWGLITVGLIFLRRMLPYRTRAYLAIGSDLLLSSLLVYAGGGFSTDLYAFFFWGVVEAGILLGWRTGLLVALLSDVLYVLIILAVSHDVSIAQLFTRLLFFTAETLPLIYCTHLETMHRLQNLEKGQLLREKERLIRELETITRDLSNYTFDVQDRAVLDHLTQLYNQTHFHNRLMVEVEKARQGGYCLSLALFDIDNFKSLNDTYGHQFGDEVLRSVGTKIIEITKNSDFITARIGGEEIAIIMPNLNAEEGYRFADLVCKRIAETVIKHEDHEYVHVTVSGGIATFPGHAEDARLLTRLADLALYAAKAQGKNRVISYEDLKLKD